eukprot:scaffold388_cov380-Prasinococcus_capsulatus_cf.AAC.45
MSGGQLHERSLWKSLGKIGVNKGDRRHPALGNVDALLASMVKKRYLQAEKVRQRLGLREMGPLDRILSLCCVCRHGRLSTTKGRDCCMRWLKTVKTCCRGRLSLAFWIRCGFACSEPRHRTSVKRLVVLCCASVQMGDVHE